MGNIESHFGPKHGMIFELPGSLCIVANARDLKELQSSPALQGLGGASLLALTSDAEVPGDLLASAKVLVLEVDPSVPASVRRIGKIRSEFAGLKIIAAMGQADVALVRTLIRQGITDVAALPFDPEELASEILEALAPLHGAGREDGLGLVTTVIRSAGGCGSTTVLTHLAAALVETDHSGRGVCVLDLDLQSGAAAAYVGASPKFSVSALLEASDRLDQDLVQSVASETPCGFTVIAAPEMITPLDVAKPEQLTGIVTLLRKRFAHVLIDLPANWTNWSLAIAADAGKILLVTDISIAGLRQARRRIDLLASVGVDPDSIKIVANRMERRFFKTIGVDDIAQALRCEVVATLSDEGSAMRSAQDQGVLLGDLAGKNGFSKGIKGLAHLLSGEDR
jgi:pilus assembly protein CpaE